MHQVTNRLFEYASRKLGSETEVYKGFENRERCGGGGFLKIIEGREIFLRFGFWRRVVWDEKDMVLICILFEF